LDCDSCFFFLADFIALAVFLLSVFCKAGIELANHEYSDQTEQCHEQAWIANTGELRIVGKNEQEKLEELQGPLFHILVLSWSFS
jgi:hypothetical protein